MTGTYDWNPMPHGVDIRCPECGGGATFEFARARRIRLKKDVEFFQRSKDFEYKRLRDSCGRSVHVAFWFPALRGRSTAVLRELPEGYSPSDWDRPRYSCRTHGCDVGTAECGSCGLRRKHELDWPRDARYRVEYRGEVLWAWHRESASSLRDFIASDARERKAHRWSSLLLHVPKAFLAAKARGELVKRLDRLLAGD